MDSINQNLESRSKRKIDALLSFGAQKELDTSLSKLIRFQIAKYHSNIKDIKNDMRKFEETYNISSEDFYQKFEAGEMGDSADFFEWVGLYENALLYHDRIYSLEAALKSD